MSEHKLCRQTVFTYQGLPVINVYDLGQIIQQFCSFISSSADNDGELVITSTF